jgi:hypothetical protein
LRVGEGTMATVEKMSPQARRTRTVVVVAGWALLVLGVGATLFLNRLTLGDALLSLVAIGAPLGLLVVLYQYGTRPAPLGYKKRRLDWAQWKRSHYCLFMAPIFLTGFAIQAAIGVREWIGPEHGHAFLIVVAYYPILAFGLTQALIAGRRGKPGSIARSDFEGLNDELTVAHAGIAHRWGLYAAFAGLIAIAATALLAPKGVLYPVIGTCWLASMTTLVRFGLLQRAAEPTSGEA